GRALAAPGAAVSIALPPLAPGWWVGEATLDPDELRADDRRVFAWRVAPPARVTAPQDAGPFVAAALAVLAEGGKVGIAGAGGARAGGGARAAPGQPPRRGLDRAPRGAGVRAVCGCAREPAGAGRSAGRGSGRRAARGVPHARHGHRGRDGLRNRRPRIGARG